MSQEEIDNETGQALSPFIKTINRLDSTEKGVLSSCSIYLLYKY